MRGVRVGDERVRCLFYADDGLLLANSIGEAEERIRELKRIGMRYGLEMNDRKSEVMIFNSENRPESVEGIGVVREIKYLGVRVGDSFIMFEMHRGEMINKAKWMRGMTYSVIEKSCHRIMIGKCYWKCVVLPRVLYGSEVVILRVKELDEIQRQEYGAMRRMLGAPRGAAKAGMRGEIGLSMVKSRVARGRVQYMRRVLQGENKMLKGVMMGAKQGRST